MLLAFAFYDSALLALLLDLGGVPPEPVENSNFYAKPWFGNFRRCVKDECYEEAPILIVASVIGLMLLVTSSIVSDDRQTLRFLQPLEFFVFDEPRPPGHWPLVNMAWRIFAGVLVQLAWIIRTMVIPFLALQGTATLMSTATSGVDVALNAIAIGFVFECALPYPLRRSIACSQAYFLSLPQAPRTS